MDIDNTHVAADDLSSHSDDLISLTDSSFDAIRLQESAKFLCSGDALTKDHDRSKHRVQQNHNSNKSAKDSNVAAHDRLFDPTESDVLLGRGRKFREHPGNVRLRDLVSKFRPEYDGSSRDAKTDISRQVVALIKTDSQSPARFLKFNKSTALWVEIDDETARLKVSHVFRDCKRNKTGSETNLLQLHGQLTKGAETSKTLQNAAFHRQMNAGSEHPTTIINAQPQGLHDSVAISQKEAIVRQQMNAFSSTNGALTQPFCFTLQQLNVIEPLDIQGLHDSTIAWQPNLFEQKKVPSFPSSVVGTALHFRHRMSLSPFSPALSPFSPARCTLPNIMINSFEFPSLTLQPIVMSQHLSNSSSAKSAIECPTSRSTLSEPFSSLEWRYLTTNNSVDATSTVHSHPEGLCDSQLLLKELDDKSNSFEQIVFRR